MNLQEVNNFKAVYYFCEIGVPSFSLIYQEIYRFIEHVSVNLLIWVSSLFSLLSFYWWQILVMQLQLMHNYCYLKLCHSERIFNKFKRNFIKILGTKMNNEISFLQVLGFLKIFNENGKHNSFLTLGENFWYIVEKSIDHQ